MEGKESGFRSLESIWTEDGGSGGHGRGGTGRLEAYRTGKALQDAELQDGWKPTERGATGRLEAYRTGKALQDAELQDG